MSATGRRGRRRHRAGGPAGGFDRYTGRGARYVDDVAAWPSVEPTLDATATGILALSVLAG